MTNDKLFTLRHDHGQYVGRTANDQLIFGAYGVAHDLIVVHFDHAGNMLDFNEESDLNVVYERSNDALEDEQRYQTSLRNALKDLGFATVEPIRVHKFFIPQHLVGIRQFPNDLQRFLESPEYSENEIAILRSLRQKLTAERDHSAFSCFFPEEDFYAFENQEEEEERAAFFKKWQEEENYVLYCSGNDYWCNVDGVITAS